LAVGALSACNSDVTSEPEHPAIQFVSEHLRAGVIGEGRLCAGTLPGLEHHMERLQSLLGLRYGAPVEIYFTNELIDCGGVPASGCWHVFERYMDTDVPSAEHELVHALFNDYSQSASYLAESVATAFSTELLYRGTVLPSHLVGLSSSEFSYRAAGHFARWLWERYGASKLVQWEASLAETPEQILSSFEDVYGVPLTVVEQTYWSEAPRYYYPLDACDDAGQALPWRDGAIEVDVTVDCDDPRVSGLDNMTLPPYFRIETPGYYLVDVGLPEETTSVYFELDGCSESLDAAGGASALGWATWFDVGLYRLQAHVSGTEPVPLRLQVAPAGIVETP